MGGNIIGLRQVQRIMKEFEDGTRTSFDRIEGSGRPKTEKRLQLVEEVKAELLADSRMSIRDLSTKFDASRQMIMDIIHNDLGFRSVHCKWIPHNLTDAHKERRVNSCQKIVEAMDKRNMQKNLVFTDEKQFYAHGIGNAASRKAWIPPDGDVPQIARRIPMAKAWMVLWAANFDGLYFFRVMP